MASEPTVGTSSKDFPRKRRQRLQPLPRTEIGRDAALLFCNK